MRAHFFSQFDGTGLLAAGTAAVDGIYNSNDDVSLHRGVGGGNPAGDEELRRLTVAHTTAEYDQFVNHSNLRCMVRNIMGWKHEIMLQRTLLRHSVPGGDSTGVHYDKLFLRAGDAFFLTAWVPIGDTTSVGGGLYYLANSAGLGEAIEEDYRRRAEHFTIDEKVSAFNRNMGTSGYLADHPEHFTSEYDRVATQEGWTSEDYEWLIGEFEAGDVVFHDPYIVHGSCGNDSPDGKIRLSTDLRFYNRDDYEAGTADTRWMHNWAVDDNL